MFKFYIAILVLIAHLPAFCCAADDTAIEAKSPHLVGTSSLASSSSLFAEEGGSSSSSTTTTVVSEAELPELLAKQLTIIDQPQMDALLASLGKYSGIYREQFYPSIADKFPDDSWMRIAVVGGRIFSGLGVLNNFFDLESQSVYLINKEKEKGLNLCLDWATPDFPAPLHEQFHVLILEQIEADTLICSKVYQNAYRALKPGGALYFNTYRPSDYYIIYKNLLASENTNLEYSEDFPTLRGFGEEIDKKEGKSWILLKEFFCEHLKKAGFESMIFNGERSLATTHLFTQTALFKDLRPKPGMTFYNSGGWVRAIKPQ